MENTNKELKDNCKLELKIDGISCQACVALTSIPPTWHSRLKENCQKQME